MSSLREGVLLRGGGTQKATPYREQGPFQHQQGSPEPQPQPQVEERRTTIRRAADQPTAGERPSFRLGDVYAEELARLREQAHAEGYAAGHAEGVKAAEVVVAEAERAAEQRLAETQERWERRLVSATTASAAVSPSAWPAAKPSACACWRSRSSSSAYTSPSRNVGRPETAVSDGSSAGGTGWSAARRIDVRRSCGEGPASR